jgi:hypothetical protein
LRRFLIAAGLVLLGLGAFLVYESQIQVRLLAPSYNVYVLDALQQGIPGLGGVSLLMQDEHAEL